MGCIWSEDIYVIISPNAHCISVLIWPAGSLFCPWETDVQECEGSRSKLHSSSVVQVAFSELEKETDELP